MGSTRQLPWPAEGPRDRRAPLRAPAAALTSAYRGRPARAQHQKAQEAIQALRQAITSGERHLERQAAEKAERDRQDAAAEAAGLGEKQRAAAERCDNALRQLEQAWAEFATIAQQRQSAARRAGGHARAAYARMLVQAAFVCAPGVSVALGLDRLLRTAHVRPLSETVG